MHSSTEQTALFEAFKKILKEQKVTYKDLAKRLDASESSIKRIFSIEECSLSRMTELLTAVQLSFADLIQIAGQRDVDTSTFSLEAEEFLADSLDYFFIYRKLFHHRSADEVRKRENLTAAKMTKYLKKLDELQVIKWLPHDKVQFSTSDFLRFREDGPLREAVYKAWTPKFHQLVLENMGDSEHTLRLFSARCTPQLRKTFLEEYELLVDSFLKRAALETKTQPTKVRSVGVSLALGPVRIGLDQTDMT